MEGYAIENGLLTIETLILAFTPSTCYDLRLFLIASLEWLSGVLMLPLFRPSQPATKQSKHRTELLLILFLCVSQHSAPTHLASALLQLSLVASILFVFHRVWRGGKRKIVRIQLQRRSTSLLCLLARVSEMLRLGRHTVRLHRRQGRLPRVSASHQGDRACQGDQGPLVATSGERGTCSKGEGRGARDQLHHGSGPDKRGSQEERRRWKQQQWRRELVSRKPSCCFLLS